MGWNLSPTLSQELANLEKDDESKKAAMKSLKLYLKNMDSEAVPLFLAKISEANNNAGSYQYGMSTIPLYEVLARVQGPKIVSQLENIMSAIVETLKKTRLQEECSKVIPAIVRYGIEPTTPEDKKQHIIDSVCKPLSGCLLSNEEGLSCGAALCLKKLVDCDNWRFASNEVVNEVCLKVAGALESAAYETDSYMGLGMSLAKKNSFVIEAYARLLVDAGLRVLRCGLSERNSQKCLISVRMLHSLMKYLNSKSIFSELELIIEELEKCVSDHSASIREAAFEALQTAKKLLSNNGLSITNSDVVSVSDGSEWSNLSSCGSSGSPKSHVSFDHDEKSDSWESYACGFPGLVPENRRNGGLRSRTPSPQRTDSQLNIDSIKIYTTPRKLLHSFQDEEDDDDEDSVNCQNQAEEYRSPVTKYDEHGHFNKDTNEESISIGNVGSVYGNNRSDCESVSSTEDVTITDVFSHEKFQRGEKHSPQVAKNSRWKIAKMLLVFLAIVMISAVLLSDDHDSGYSHYTLVPT